MERIFDVAVVGGGINGCGVAADASLRGLSVVLAEKDDLASKTSSNSTKLIHGGLRYLEYFNFSLVKKSLDERQTLLKLAPQLVHPLPFVLPFQPSMRPVWKLQAGLFVYDHLSRKNNLPDSRLIRRSNNEPYFSPLDDQFIKGFLFYDCATDDARLTLANALQAKTHGASILTNSEIQSAVLVNKVWHLGIKQKQGTDLTIKARSLVNATGPWASATNKLLNIPNHYNMSLVKGSHIIVRKLYEGSHAYLLQNDDHRIAFVVPYHGFTMIGTTDIVFSENLDKVSIDSEEIDYLFEMVARYFKKPLSREDIVHTLSGVRPLLAARGQSPQAMSRDYTWHFSSLPGPVITIYGGKITTYRQLARDAVNELSALFPSLAASTTDHHPLPGAVFNEICYKDYLHYARSAWHWLDDEILGRLLTTYGTYTEKVLKGSRNMGDLGKHFGCGLYQREVDYLVREEWACTCDDVLWRRTKLGLQFRAAEREILEKYLTA